MKKIGGSLRHLRREQAPRYWPILKKEYVWTVKPSPGPHPIDRSIPLAILIREVLGYAKNMREARRIIAQGKIKVDGVVRKDYKFPVGLMDVIEIPETGEYYRIVPHPTKVLYPVQISSEEAQLKVCRINGKTMVKGGNIQLNLHDGRNILIKLKNPAEPVEDTYKTYDSLLIKIPSQEIVEHIPFKVGSRVVIIQGRNVGTVGEVLEINQIFKKSKSIVTIREEKTGNIVRTILEYSFPVPASTQITVVAGDENV